MEALVQAFFRKFPDLPNERARSRFVALLSRKNVPMVGLALMEPLWCLFVAGDSGEVSPAGVPCSKQVVPDKRHRSYFPR